MIRQIFFGCGTRNWTASFGVLFLRISIGAMMLFGHGLPKLKNFQNILDSERGWYTPDFFPLQWMSESVSLGATITAEVGAAALIMLGLSTRFAAFLLGFTMVVAAFVVNADAPVFFDPNPETPKAMKELALLYLFPMVTLIIIGAGRFSLDAVVGKDRRSKLKIAI